MGGNAPKKSDVLYYTGGATTRRVTKAEWEAAGVKDQDTVVWNRQNGKQCKCGDLSADALNLLLERNGREFRVVSSSEAEELSEETEAPRSSRGPVPPAPNGNV